MVIYVEYVIFDNFLLDLLIGFIVCKLLHLRCRRAFLSAFIGTILALIYPQVGMNLLVIYKVLTLLSCSLPFVGKTFRSWIKPIFVYVVASFIFNGLISLGLNTVSDLGYYNSGGKVGIIAGGAILGFFVVLKFAMLLMNRLSGQKYLKLKLCVGDKELKAVGFLDTGNLAKASDGKGIIFLDKFISKKVQSEIVDYVFINTVGSNKIFNVIKIDKLLIYFEGKEHIYIDVNAVKTDRTYQGFQILLSSNLEEVSV